MNFIDSMHKDYNGWTSLIQCNGQRFNGWTSLIQWTKIIMDELHWFNAMDKDNYGWTPFIFACRYGHQDAVKLFVKWNIFGDFEPLWVCKIVR